jgi:hypothetical protein
MFTTIFFSKERIFKINDNLKTKFMKRSTLASICFIFSLCLVSCGRNSNNNTDTSTGGEETDTKTSALTTYDLSKKEIPVIIEGPEGASVEDGMMGEVEIEGVKTISVVIIKDGFKLEVSMESEPSGETLEESVAFLKEISQEEVGFELIREESNGFIYKTTEDGETNHDFNYVKMNEKGEAIKMTTGFSLTNYSLKDVEKIYKAAKKATWK